jgi:hypothetical protein
MKNNYFNLIFIVISIFFLQFIYSAQAARFSADVSSTSEQVKSKDTFSLLTWNILGLQAGDAPIFLQAMERYENQEKRLDDIIFAIFSWDADIVCLQEVSQITLSILCKKLDEKYTMSSWSQKGPTGGVAIFSKKDLFVVSGNISQELSDSVDRFSGSVAGTRLIFRDDFENILGAGIVK